jgi:hypothetical protein
VYVIFGDNMHTVIPGEVYRCAQPTAEMLPEFVARYGIRTVINLRGCNPTEDWYQEEALTTCDLDICQEDISFSSARIPSSSELRRLIEVLDWAERPLLIHCRRGSDRTGLTATVVLLLREGVSLSEALANLGVRFGHLEVGRTARMDDFFQYYVDWLREHNLEHSPTAFRRWALEEYRGGYCRCVFEVCEPLRPLRAGQPLAFHVRVRNAGSLPWKMHPLVDAGCHLYFVLFDAQGKIVRAGKAGLLQTEVAPGKTIELTLPIDPVAYPGAYHLAVDMHDELQGSFYQMGSEPLDRELIIRE